MKCFKAPCILPLWRLPEIYDERLMRSYISLGTHAKALTCKPIQAPSCPSAIGVMAMVGLLRTGFWVASDGKLNSKFSTRFTKIDCSSMTLRETNHNESASTDSMRILERTKISNYDVRYTITKERRRLTTVVIVSKKLGDLTRCMHEHQRLQHN